MKAPNHKTDPGIPEMAGEAPVVESTPGVLVSLPHDCQLSPAEWSALARKFLTLVDEGKLSCGSRMGGAG
jgi:hypothetical protein